MGSLFQKILSGSKQPASLYLVRSSLGTTRCEGMSEQTRSLEFGVQGPMMVGRDPGAPLPLKGEGGSVCLPALVSYLFLPLPLILHSSQVAYSKKGRFGAQGELSNEVRPAARLVYAVTTVTRPVGSILHDTQAPLRNHPGPLQLAHSTDGELATPVPARLLFHPILAPPPWSLQKPLSEGSCLPHPVGL